MTQEQKQALYEDLSKEFGKEKAADVVAEKELENEVQKGQETVINLPDNFSEVVAEKIAKLEEAKEKAQKKFKFHGDAPSKAKLDVATKKLEANKFIKLVSEGNYKEAGELESVKTRAKALTEGTAATAGVLVPELFESEIFSNFDTYSEIIGDARVRDYGGAGDVVNLNQLDAKVIVYETAELAPTTASTPSYSAPNLEFTKYTTEVIMSEEFVEDTEADIMSNISEQIAEDYAEIIQNRFVNRSTASQEGLLQVSGVTAVTMGNAGSYLNSTFADLKQMQTQLSSVYNKREGLTGKYYMNVLTWDAVIDNTTTSGSAYSQYSVNPFEGTPMRAHGRDVRIVNEIATPTVTGTKFVIFSDLSKHLVIGRKRGMRMKVNTTGTASDGINLNTEDARQLVMNARIGHVVVLPAGVVTLVS